MKYKIMNVICYGSLLLAVVYVLCTFLFMESKDKVSVQTVNLRSINYQNVSEGVFILGSGKLDGQDYYTCYQVLDDGGLKLIKFEGEKTVIYETLTSGDAYAEMSIDGWGDTKEVKLYVPQNTIQKEYDFRVGE
jgi:hypothetical protein